MNILISSIDNYKVPTMVMLTSFFDCNPEKHTVYMLESALSDGADAKIRELVGKYGAEYVRIHLAEDLFADARTRSYISRETYFRLLAAKLLPAGTDRVLWLDSDILVRGDLNGFYERELGEYMAAACGYGPAMREIIGKNAADLGLEHPETYFNAGVILMNLPVIRECVDEDRLRRLVTSESTAKFMFQDQDIANLIFDGRVQLADYRVYNCMIHSIEGTEDLEDARRNAVIIHFAGEAKPWKFNDIHFADEWMECYRKCFGGDRELKRMSYFRLKALYALRQKHDTSDK